MAPHFTKMVSLHRTEEDKKKHEEKMKDLIDAKPDGLEYPPGCCICLTDEVLEKLGIDGEDMPDHGDTVHLCIMARVSGINQDKMGRRIELQIESIAMENEDDENEAMSSEARAKGRYGDKEAA